MATGTPSTSCQQYSPGESHFRNSLTVIRSGSLHADTMARVYHGQRPRRHDWLRHHGIQNPLPDGRAAAGSLRGDPGVDATPLPALVNLQSVERDDLLIAGPDAHEGWLGRAEHTNVIQPLPRIDHGDIRTAGDEVMCDPMGDRPFLGRRRIDVRPPQLALQRPHRVEP